MQRRSKTIFKTISTDLLSSSKQAMRFASLSELPARFRRASSSTKTRATNSSFGRDYAREHTVADYQSPVRKSTYVHRMDVENSHPDSHRLSHQCPENDMTCPHAHDTRHRLDGSQLGARRSLGRWDVDVVTLSLRFLRLDISSSRSLVVFVALAP